MEKPFRLLITGSRDWENRTTIRVAIHEVVCRVPNPVIIHGGCPSGADMIASKFASSCLLREEVHFADWNQYGLKAGPLRNSKMVDLGADICLAFIKNRSRGASDCARKAVKAGIETRVFYE